jgi:bis(5'-nucleosidyl)-tetraphosphatase
MFTADSIHPIDHPKVFVPAAARSPCTRRGRSFVTRSSCLTLFDCVPADRSKPASTTERSAGVIVYRFARGRGAGATREREYLLLDYGRYWDFPKGHVEAGEDDFAAAVRELHEEAGIAADQARIVDGFAKEITYFFRARGRLVRKHVVLFAAETAVTDRQVTISYEHVGFGFFAYDQALSKLKYPTAKEVLEAAHAFLTEHGPASE